MTLAYLDFDLEIGQPTGQSYPVTVLYSPAGEARATMAWTLSELALENRLKDLQIALLSSGGVQRRVLTPAEAAVQRFGGELFDLLFTGEVRNRYDVSWERAQHQGKGLRIRLRSQSAALANLPWEYLYDPRTGHYLCLSQQTPLVRYLDLPQPIQPLGVTPPLRLLAMIAAPSDLQELDVTVERQRLERAIAPLQTANLVELRWLEGATRRELQRALRREPWHLFHFIGHGDFDQRREEGLVAFCDDLGRAQLFSAPDLGHLLADYRTLRLAVLNACLGAQGSGQDRFASTAATMVRSGIPAVIAMQHAITDRAAIEFSQTFYESLADGLSVDGAVGEARKAIRLGVTNSLEWGTPVLYSRASDGRLFNVAAQDTRSETRAGETSVTGDVGRGMGRGGVMPSEGYDPRIAPAKPKPSIPRYPDTTIPFDWVTIPAGEFIMGSDKAKDKDAYKNELHQFSIELLEYRIARVPVTVAQFAQFVKVTNYKTRAEKEGSALIHTGEELEWVEGADWSHPRGPQSDVKQKEDHPVTCLSWHDAMAFCEWARVRLPSEAEWEKAARGTDGRIYPWGNDAPDKSHCNFNMNVGDTTPIGMYLIGASPYGCLDMAGNVWEWTSTKWLHAHEDYLSKVDNLFLGEDGRVVRGGGFDYNSYLMRVAARNKSSPYHRYYNIGMRVALSPLPL